MMETFTVFLRESYAELKKVTWLSRKEVIGSTIVIIILIAILSLFVTFVDFVFIKMIGVIL